MWNENNTCLHLSGANSYNQEVYPIDERHPEYGVRMKFTGGYQCAEKDDEVYSLSVQINCDASVTEPTWELDQ